MRILMIVLALILISCKKEIAPKPAGEVVDSVKVETADTSWKDDTTFIDSTDEFVFRVIGYNTIEILNEKDGSHFQTLHPDFINADLTFSDANFDGYTDISYPLPNGASADHTVDFWVYNPSKKVFQFDTVLSSLINPIINTINSEIITSQQDWHQYLYSEDLSDGLDSFQRVDTFHCQGHRQDSHKYINGKLTVTFSKVICNSPTCEDSLILTHLQLRNTHMDTVLSSRVFLKDGEFIKGFNPSDYLQKKRTN